jgi:hypothetical protein
MRTPAYRIAATLIATATTRGIIFDGYIYGSSQLTNLPIPYSILFNKKEPHPYG